MTETQPAGRPASNATRWARWRSRPTRCTAPRPSGRSSTSRSRARACRRRFLRALALVKLAAAETNGELGLLDADVAGAIAAAARPVADGDHDDQFPIDIYQTGSGTSTNTNMNEVVAHLAGGAARGGRKVHPNDDVNRCQSSNDTIPTALQLSAAIAIEERAAARARAPAHRARRQGAGVLAGGQDRPDAPPGRDPDPPRPGVPRLRRPGRGGAPAGPRRPGRAARSAARRDGGRDRHQRPPRVRVPGLRPAVGADRADRARDHQPLPRPVDDRRRHRGPRRDPDDRAEPVEDRLGRATDGDGAARRASPSSRCPRRSPGRASCPAR